MKKITQEQCLQIGKVIKPNLNWVWNDSFDSDNPPFYAINGTGQNELWMMKFYYTLNQVKIINGNDDNFEEIEIDFLNNKEILNILNVSDSVGLNNTTNPNEKIKMHYVLEGEIDKFTKIAEYEMPYPGLTLESQLITEYIQSKDELAATMEQLTGKKKKGSGISTLRMELIYRHKAEQDILIIKLELFLYALHLVYDESILKGSQIFLLIDDNDTLDCGKIIDYKSGAGPAGFGLEETAHLETDFAFLAKLASANKLEYRVIGKRGKISEGEFSKSDVFRIKGFYNGLFDPEFMKEELLKQIDIDEAEKQREEEEERKKKEAQAQKAKPTNTSSSSCFVITATMGDPYHPIVDEFRAYRDRKLLTNSFGKAFVSFYYKVGPYAASIISKSEILRKFSFSFFVNPIYKRLKNDRNTNKN
jgi:hypothetical protein